MWKEEPERVTGITFSFKKRKKVVGAAFLVSAHCVPNFPYWFAVAGGQIQASSDLIIVFLGSTVVSF